MTTRAICAPLISAQAVADNIQTEFLQAQVAPKIQTLVLYPLEDYLGLQMQYSFIATQCIPVVPSFDNLATSARVPAGYVCALFSCVLHISVLCCYY